MAEPPGRGPLPLVADVADRNPFGEEWAGLDVVHVERFLVATTDDEPLHWEAKSGKVTPDHVRHAVTAFANREGGYLIIGAERDPGRGTWSLPGVELPGTEPLTWGSNVVRSAVSPPPDFDIRSWDRPDGRKAAVIRVQPNCGFLSMTMGRVYYRRPGESSYVENGAELQTIQNAVQYRSRALPGGGHPVRQAARQPPAPLPLTLDMQTDRDTAADLIRELLEAGNTTRVNIYLSAAAHALLPAIEAGDEPKLNDALDRITDLAAVSLSDKATEAPVIRAIEALHEAFDHGLHARGGANRVPREQLWVATLARARAVGALAVRLRHWEPARLLVSHKVDPQESRVWQMWFRFGDVWASRSRLYSSDNNVLESSRVPLRLAAGHALRLPTLRPDELDDEDALITSLCQFDFVTNLVAAWEARADPPREAAFPYFAAWEGERVRPTAERLISDPNCRGALLSGTDDQDLADLLRQVSEYADRMSQSMGSWGFWDGFIGGKVQAFLARNPPRG